MSLVHPPGVIFLFALQRAVNTAGWDPLRRLKRNSDAESTNGFLVYGEAYAGSQEIVIFPVPSLAE
jgi:hypothetical protein